jgi:ABC-2 type transport system permease protein
MTTNLFRLLLHQELKLLSRNRILATLFSLVLVVLVAALWVGSSQLHQQQRTMRQIQAHGRTLDDSLQTRIQRIEGAGMRYPGFIWDDPTFAYNTARNEGPQYAVKQPFALQALAAGQRDVQPYYYKVYITKKQQLVHEGEIDNSFLQFIGQFDVAFVVIYLLPLLIIVFTYNVLSSEKEQGTWVLLKTSNQSLAGLMLGRIGIRYALFTGFFWAIVGPGLSLLVGPGFLATANWWWLVGFVSLYFAFWFGLALLVNSFSLSSNLNALTLLAAWLVLCLLLPNLLQVGLNRAYPIPSRISLTTAERNAINQYFEKDGQQLTREVFNSPRTQIRQASIVTPGMVYGYGVIVYKSQEIKDQATRVAEQQLYGQIEHQQLALRQLQFLSPALLLQEVLSALAGTHWHQYNQFSRDVDAFRYQTQRFYYPKMANEQTYRTFSVTDAIAIPRFRPREYASFAWLPVGRMLLSYAVVVALLGLVGYRRLLSASR